MSCRTRRGNAADGRTIISNSIIFLPTTYSPVAWMRKYSLRSHAEGSSSMQTIFSDDVDGQLVGTDVADRVIREGGDVESSSHGVNEARRCRIDKRDPGRLAVDVCNPDALCLVSLQSTVYADWWQPIQKHSKTASKQMVLLGPPPQKVINRQCDDLTFAATALLGARPQSNFLFAIESPDRQCVLAIRDNDGQLALPSLSGEEGDCISFWNNESYHLLRKMDRCLHLPDPYIVRELWADGRNRNCVLALESSAPDCSRVVPQ
eukprot:IDg2095t1